MAAEKIDALELGINAKLSTENLDKLIDSLKKLSKELDKVQGKKPAQEIREVGDSAEESAKGIDSFVNQAVRVAAVIAIFKKLGDVIGDGVSKSMTYTKTLNMFTVSLGEYADNATKYADAVHDALGIDIAGWQDKQGVFQTLITGFGVAGDQAAYMSQNLTQLTYDIASFYNLTTEEAQKKVQAAISGRLEPIRKLGYDLSQSKLVDIAKNPANYGQQTYSINQQTGAIEANTAAIDDNTEHKIVNFNQLTQQEKVQLRYIALMTQVTQVQGNMAKTLQDPANRTRIFKEQLEMTSRALGNIFIPTINAALPYLTAFAQLVEEAFNALAALFGYEIPDMSDRIDISGNVDPYNDVVEATGRAAKNAKKIRDYTIGIDELNVLREPDTTGGGGGVSGEQTNLSNLLTPGYDFLSKAIKNSVEQAKENIKLLFDGFKQHPFEFPMKILWQGAEILGENFWEAYLGMTPEELAQQAYEHGTSVGEEFWNAFKTVTGEKGSQLIELIFGSPEDLGARAAEAGRTIAEQFLWEFAQRLYTTKTDEVWKVEISDRAKYMFGADFGNTSANEAYKQSQAYKDALEAQKRLKSSPTLAKGTGTISTSNANLKMAIALPSVSLGNTAADEARKQGEKLAKAYAEGINSGKTDANNAGLSIYNSSKNGANNNGNGANGYKYVSADMAKSFNFGLNNAQTKAGAYIAGQAIGSQASAGAKSYKSGFTTAGEQSGAGYVGGVNNKTNLKKAAEAGKTIASNALKKLKEVLGIHSPSRAFGEAGYDSVLGYANWVNKYSYLASNATKDMAQSAIKAVNTANSYFTNGMSIPTTTNAGYNVGMANQGAMASLASNIYNAVVSGLANSNNEKGDTVVMIDGKEIYRVVRKEERKSGVAISNGAFSTI